jgi:hypothetical protein
MKRIVVSFASLQEPGCPDWDRALALPSRRARDGKIDRDWEIFCRSAIERCFQYELLSSSGPRLAREGAVAALVVSALGAVVRASSLFSDGGCDMGRVVRAQGSGGAFQTGSPVRGTVNKARENVERIRENPLRRQWMMTAAGWACFPRPAHAGLA